MHVIKRTARLGRAQRVHHQAERVPKPTHAAHARKSLARTTQTNLRLRSNQSDSQPFRCRRRHLDWLKPEVAFSWEITSHEKKNSQSNGFFRKHWDKNPKKLLNIFLRDFFSVLNLKGSNI